MNDLFYPPGSNNPIIRHIRSADPAAHVWDDGRIWIYCSQDQNDAVDYSTMDGYHAFSSSDMVHWTDHGEILHSHDVAWGIKEGGWMWAPDCAYKNGTWYLYFCHRDTAGAWRIGVATSTRPQGPFTDIGNYIEGTSGIDPCCFVDDDGSAYLYFGRNKMARLAQSMVALDGPVEEVDYGNTNFGEGVWVHKYNGRYYYSWTDYEDQHYQGHYSVGSSPFGPFEYIGCVNKKPPGAQDHHAIIEYKNQWYYFYHVGNYNNGGPARRNVCVDYLYYSPDGAILMVIQTAEGVDSVGGEK